LTFSPHAPPAVPPPGYSFSFLPFARPPNATLFPYTTLFRSCLQSFRQNLFPPGCAAGCESLGLYPRLQRFVPIRQAYLTLMIILWGSLGLGMRPGWVDALARWAHVRCVADRWLVPGR